MTTVRPTPAARTGPVPAVQAPRAVPRAEIALVTADTALAGALRAAAPTISITMAATPAALADVLLARPCAALLLDVATLGPSTSLLAGHLAHQFPEIPLVAIGTRADEAGLAALVAAGQLYRFMHRPVSPERARLFIAAALRRQRELAHGAAASALPPGPSTAPRGRRPSPAALAAGACAALALLTWLLPRPSGSSQAASVDDRPLPITRLSTALPVARRAAGSAATAPDSAPGGAVGAAVAAPGRHARAEAPAAEPLPAPAAPEIRLDGAVADPALPERATPEPAEVPLTRLEAPAPAYPPDARVSGAEGWVEVSFTVGSDGRTHDVRATAADPARLFDAAAVEAVRGWRYAPLPAPRPVVQRVRFQLR